jgi:hypothetical protein
MDPADPDPILSLAADYRARAESADPEIARILREIADDLQEEARRLSESRGRAGG